MLDQIDKPKRKRCFDYIPNESLFDFLMGRYSFEFTTSYPIEQCVKFLRREQIEHNGFWDEFFSKPETDVDIYHYTNESVDFFIRKEKGADRSRPITMYEGHLETLGDGTTRVQGQIRAGSILWLIIFLSPAFNEYVE